MLVLSEAQIRGLQNPIDNRIRVVVLSDGESHTILPRRINCNASFDYTQWNIEFRNTDGYSCGSFSECPVKVQWSQDGNSWYDLMTGIVATEGLVRSVGNITDDQLTMAINDICKSKGVNRKPDKTAYAGYRIYNEADKTKSLIHILGNTMGILDYDILPVSEEKDLIILGDNSIWSEFQDLADAFGAILYFDNEGKLVFHSPNSEEWEEPSSEWSIVADNSNPSGANWSRLIGRQQETYEEKECTRAKCTFEKYSGKEFGVIYRDTTNWKNETQRCFIEVRAGATYPMEGGVLKCDYHNPTQDEDYAYATDVRYPVIGQSEYADIYYTGGDLRIEHFENTSDGAEITLKNYGNTTATIHSFRIFGKPFVKDEDINVQQEDASVVGEENHIEKERNGRWVCSREQIETILERDVDKGKDHTRKFTAQTIFLPHVRLGMGITYIDDKGNATLCTVREYSHEMMGGQIHTLRTNLTLKEEASFSPSIQGKVEVTHPTPAVIEGAPGASVTVEYALGTSRDVPPSSEIVWAGQDAFWGQQGAIWNQSSYSGTVPSSVPRGQYIWMRVKVGDGEWQYTRLTGSTLDDSDYFGILDSEPGTTPDGKNLVVGDSYVDSETNAIKVYNGSNWVSLSASGLTYAKQSEIAGKAQKDVMSRITPDTVTSSDYAYFNTLIVGTVNADYIKGKEGVFDSIHVGGNSILDGELKANSLETFSNQSAKNLSFTGQSFTKETLDSVFGSFGLFAATSGSVTISGNTYSASVSNPVRIYYGDMDFELVMKVTIGTQVVSYGIFTSHRNGDVYTSVHDSITSNSLVLPKINAHIETADIMPFYNENSSLGSSSKSFSDVWIRSNTFADTASSIRLPNGMFMQFGTLPSSSMTYNENTGLYSCSIRVPNWIRHLRFAMASWGFVNLDVSFDYNLVTLSTDTDGFKFVKYILITDQNS